MLQLIYLSKATDMQDAESLAAIRQQAAKNNVRDEITSMLLYREGWFLQALEGPQVPVEDRFLRMIGDPRHCDLKLLSRRLISWREFGEQPLTHVEDDAETRLLVEQISQIVATGSERSRADFAERFGSSDGAEEAQTD